MHNIRSAPGVLVTVLAWVVPLAACGTEPAGTERSGAARVTVGTHPSPSDNGIAAKTPREAMAAARQALAAAKSVHVHGYLEPKETGPTKIDEWYGRDGARGTMSARMNGKTGKWVTMEHIEIGGKSYTRGGFFLDFLPPEVAARIKDRWVIMTEPQVPRHLLPPELGGPGDPAGPPPATADGPGGPPSAVPSGPLGRQDITSLAEEFRPEDAVSSTGRTTIGGLPAVGIRLESALAEGDMIVYIATTGTPRILRQEVPGDRRNGIDFTEYDVPFSLSAPSDVVDLETIMR